MSAPGERVGMGGETPRTTWQDADETCPMCGRTGWVETYEWDSGYGGEPDVEKECLACGRSWWPTDAPAPPSEAGTAHEWLLVAIRGGCSSPAALLRQAVDAGHDPLDTRVAMHNLVDRGVLRWTPDSRLEGAAGAAEAGTEGAPETEVQDG